MATSIKLARDLADTLGLPEPTVLHVLRGVRSGNLITSHGRGVSAVPMQKEDAIALLIGIGSGATAARVGEVTSQLMKMPLRRCERPDDDQILSKLRNTRYGFYNLQRDHSFFEGFSSLLDVEWEEVESDEEAQETPRVSAFDRAKEVGVTIGMDGRKSGGFAIIRAGSYLGTIRNFYSTWNMKAKENTADPDLGQMFDAPAAAFTVMHFGGEVLLAAKESLKEKVKTERVRLPRQSRAIRA
jgi:hypothetical protein